MSAVKESVTGSEIRILEGDLRRMFPHARQDYIDVILANEELFDAHGLTGNHERWCAFIANVAEETGGLTIVRENMRYTARNLLRVWPSRYKSHDKARSHARRGAKFVANYNYGFRLGNRGRNTNDGFDFRGALLLQATGRRMAEWLQRETQIPFADDPEHFNNIAYAPLVACLTWTSQDSVGNLNDWADRGQFRACCNGINRGNPRSRYNPIGWAGRQRAYKKALRIWGPDANVSPFERILDEGDSGWEVRKYQERLQSLGYHSVGTIDGAFGDNTTTAVMNFQRVNGLVADGRIGPKTRALFDSDDVLSKPVSDERANATVSDLKKSGSGTVSVADAGRKSGGLLAIIGGAGAVNTALEPVKQFNETVGATKQTLEPAIVNLKWLIEWWPLGLIALGLIGYTMFGNVIKKRLEDHHDGKHTGR